MLHTVDRCYYEEPFYFRDADDIREDIMSVKSALREANRKIKELDEIRESMREAIGEMKNVRGCERDAESEEKELQTSFLRF